MSSEDFNSDTNEMNGKEEMRSTEAELGEQMHTFILDIPSTLTPSSVHNMEMDIKYEDLDFNINTSTTEPDVNSVIKTASTTPDFDSSSVKTEEKDLNYFYLDLDRVKCEQDCEMPQPIQDPLLIDPFHIDHDLDLPHPYHSSFVQIKSEVKENVEKMKWSEEVAERDPDFKSKVKKESDPDPECDPEPSPLTPIVYGTYMPKVSKMHSQFICILCGEVARTHGGLKVHMRMTHFGGKEKAFKCSECDKCFSNKSSLTAHGRVHTGERPFKCRECGMTFTWSRELTMHRRFHTGERPNTCDMCQMSFTSESHLNRHNVETHPTIL